MSQKQQTETGPDPAVESNWSAFTKWVLSVIAIGHLSIVFTSPWALPQPSSQLARTVNDWTSPISNLLYMQHGYRFFAPDPGPSHLIVYEITQADGSVIKGTFPDRQVHRPRLLYHRFFMISEHFWGLGVASNRSSHELGQGLQKAEDYLRKNGFSWQADWIQQNRPRHELELLSSADIHRIVEDLKSQGKFHAAKTAQKNLEAQQAGMEILRKHRDVWLTGIANYLKKTHAGTKARIWVQEHLIPDYDHILDGGKLTDRENYGPRQLVYSEDEVIE